MRSPRRVTIAPIGIPARSLKAAIDFFARVTTGAWPVIHRRSLTAASSARPFWTASPRPMLTTILSSFGT